MYLVFFVFPIMHQVNICHLFTFSESTNTSQNEAKTENRRKPKRRPQPLPSRWVGFLGDARMVQRYILPECCPIFLGRRKWKGANGPPKRGLVGMGGLEILGGWDGGWMWNDKTECLNESLLSMTIGWLEFFWKLLFCIYLYQLVWMFLDIFVCEL